MSEKIENHDDWLDNFGGASDSGDGNAPAPQSANDNFGISEVKTEKVTMYLNCKSGFTE